MKRAVPALVSPALALVMCAVYFHDEPCCRSEEVDDEAVDDDLAAKLYADLRRPERLPKPLSVIVRPVAVGQGDLAWGRELRAARRVQFSSQMASGGRLALSAQAELDQPGSSNGGVS